MQKSIDQVGEKTMTALAVKWDLATLLSSGGAPRPPSLEDSIFEYGQLGRCVFADREKEVSGQA
jgi:hypothetical protein